MFKYSLILFFLCAFTLSMSASPEFGFHSYIVKHKRKATVTEYELGNVPTFSNMEITMDAGDTFLGAILDDSYYGNALEHYAPSVSMRVVHSGSVSCTTITDEISKANGITVSVAGTYIVSYDEETKTFSWKAPKEADQMFVIGDMNGDGVLSIADVTLLTSTILGERDIQLHLCESSGDVDVEEPTPVLVESIELNAASLTLKEGESGTLTATILPENADERAVVWTSSDTEIAEVSTEGVVTAKAPGSCTITATAIDGSEVSAACLVTVESNIKTYDSPTITKAGTTTIKMSAEEGQTLSFDYEVTLNARFDLYDSSWPVTWVDKLEVTITPDGGTAVNVLKLNGLVSQDSYTSKKFTGKATYTFPLSGTYTLTFKLTRECGSGGATIQNITVQ